MPARGLDGGHGRRRRSADSRQSVIIQHLLRVRCLLRAVRDEDRLHIAFDQVEIILSGEAELLVAGFG